MSCIQMAKLLQIVQSTALQRTNTHQHTIHPLDARYDSVLDERQLS
jgi:hypothetical protein